MHVSRLSVAAFAALFLALALAACGTGSTATPSEPFVAAYPPEGPGGGSPPPTTPPPDEQPTPPVFDADAFVHDRTVLYGSFPSDVVRYGSTIFTTDADQVTDEGAWVVPIDASGASPRPSTQFVPFRIDASDLVDSGGSRGDAASPIGFGYFLNDVAIAGDHLGFVLANAGGSDSTPTLCNLIAFDPSTGTRLQVVDLAQHHPSAAGLLDSSGAPVPLAGFVQSGAEAVTFVPTGSGTGRLYVALTNLLFAPPSSGTVKYPGTIQVYDVVVGAAHPVVPRTAAGLATETFLAGGFNPVALTPIVAESLPGFPGARRLLVTIAGTTAYDATFRLVPVTDASVAAYDVTSGNLLGRFLLGPAGLAGTRPAVGMDAAGHRVAFLPSAVNGEVYLLRLDGLYDVAIDPDRVAVLRGPLNGIPIAADQTGGPGGNVTGVALAPDGQTLVVAGFGDLFAFPEPRPGRLYLLGLPDDVVSGSGFGADFIPGWSLYGTAPGRALGAVALAPNPGTRPDVYVAVSSPLDPSTFLAEGPGSLGTLQTFGIIR